MKKVFFVIGTRPELIKCAPLIKKLQSTPEVITLICFTGQHKELIEETASFLKILPDMNLKLMLSDQSPASFVSRSIEALDKLFLREKPDMVLVQGDTSSVLAGALAAFYHKIAVGHIEAGLRSFDKNHPFPEEMNRVLVSSLATLHFAPTLKSFQNLKEEKIHEHIYLTGNTVVDALYQCKSLIQQMDESVFLDFFREINFSRKVIVVTVHRRENFGENLTQILNAITSFALEYPEAQFVIPVHPNPNIKNRIIEYLSAHNNILLYDALSYPQMVWLMMHTFIILTDSGGLQEEAPTFKIPTLVLRKNTERTESLDAGTSKLVPVRTESILAELKQLYTDKDYYHSFQKEGNPYGDGTAATKIVDAMMNYLS